MADTTLSHVGSRTPPAYVQPQLAPAACQQEVQAVHAPTRKAASCSRAGARQQKSCDLGQLDLVLHTEALEALRHVKDIPAS